MKKSRWTIFIIIGVVILVLIWIIGIKLFVSAGEAFDEAFVIQANEVIVRREDEEITGEGQITSFNIENLDTSLWTNTDKVLVNNEDIVTTGQEILNVSNDEATGKIYSTISGKIYIEDGRFGKKYTIYDLENVGYELEVPESKIKDLKIGQKVETKIIASNEFVEGKICYISQIPQDEQIKVKVKLENNDKIKIGYTVEARVLTDEPVDESVTVYDIKNSIPKIGKTTINYKTNGEEVTFSSFEEMFSDNDLIAMYESALEEQGIIIEELSAQIQELTDNYSTDEIQDENTEEINVEEISQYWSGYWKEYWEAEYNKMLEENNNSKEQESLEGE